MRYKPVYTLLWMLICQASCGQKQAATHQDHINYNIKDTVTPYGPHTMVRNIKKGSNGSILLTGSWGGVFRYDGKQFTNIASKIGSHRYWDVLQDSRGDLWLATTDSGVYHYNGKAFGHFTTREGLANNLVFSVFEDKAGNIWFGTGGGISSYDGKAFKTFTKKNGLPDNGATTIMQDRAGKLWFSSGGVSVYDGKSFTTLKNKDGNAFRNVWSIIEDRKGNIWFGDANGLWRYDGSIATQVSQKGASAIMEDKDGNIWTTGTVHPNGAGAWKILRYDQKTLYSKEPAITEIMSVDHMLCGILQANDGSIWIGSLFGAYRYDGKTITELKRKADQQ